MSSSIKLTYFDVMGLGESIRMLLKYGDIDFVDNRLIREDWPELKKKMPFGQVPFLEENGRTAHQSTAIARYVAKKVKLVGSNDWENLEIDAIVDTINDIRGRIQQYFYEKDPAVKASFKGILFEETIPFYLAKFEEIAKQNNGHLAIGKLTWADFFFAGMQTYLNSMAGTNLIEKCPNLRKVVENVHSIPKVKAWIEQRPKSNF